MCSNKPKQQNKQRKLLPGEVPKPTAAGLTPEELKNNRALFEKMSGLADQFVSNGEADIYQETYERLKFKLDLAQPSTTSKTTDAAFDMYGDTDVSASVNKPTTDTPSKMNLLDGRQLTRFNGYF